MVIAVAARDKSGRRRPITEVMLRTRPPLPAAATVLIGVGVLASLPATAGAATSCVPHVDRTHTVHAGGVKGFVKATKGGIRELVVRGVGPSAARRAVDDETRCDIDLEAFEQRFRAHPHKLHARLGKLAVRVTSVDYDPAAGTLRTKGRIERGPRAARAAGTASCVPSSAPCPTVIVYASTFIPFDSSF